MLAYLKGKIIIIGEKYIVLDVHDVGYKIFVSQTSRYKINSTVSLWLHHQLREDKSDLFGFADRQELEFFELLLKVNGVGPKMGLNILSKANMNELKQAISSGDIKLLTSVGGVGKKVAGKIIVELKGKISSGDKIDLNNTTTEEVIEALGSLGYKPSEITPYLSKIPAKYKLSSDKVKWLLKNMKS